MLELTDLYPVERLCECLDVSKSAFYAYRAKQTYQPTLEKRQLVEAAKSLFHQHERRYGSRRLVLDLQEQGFEVGRHQLRKIMIVNQLQAIQPRSFVPRTTNSNHAGPYSPNLLLDRPAPTRPGEVLVGDITYLPLVNGDWAYLGGWLDLFSRKMSGWSVDEHMGEGLVHSALQRAIGHNQLDKGSIIHSDRGGQYVGKEFRKTLRLHQFEQSMARAVRCMTMPLLSRTGRGSKPS